MPIKNVKTLSFDVMVKNGSSKGVALKNSNFIDLDTPFHFSYGIEKMHRAM